MKKEYTNPIIEIIEIYSNDVITTSGEKRFGNSEPGDTEINWWN